MTNERDAFNLHIEAYQKLVEQYIDANPETDISRINSNRLRWYVVHSHPPCKSKPADCCTVGKPCMRTGVNETTFETLRFRHLHLPVETRGNQHLHS